MCKAFYKPTNNKENMNVNNLVKDETEIDESVFKQLIYASLSNISSRELAYAFKIGDEEERIIYRGYLETQFDSYKKEFEEHLKDPLLGERIEDDFEDEDD